MECYFLFISTNSLSILIRAHKSRMNTLARKLQVTECNGEGKDVLNMPQINYMKVNNAVEDYRSFSIECLKKLLEI